MRAQKRRDLRRGNDGRVINEQRCRFTAADIEKALRATLGNYRAAAAALEQATGRPCSRQLIEYHVRMRPALQDVVSEVLEEAKDIAESTVLQAMLAGDANIALRFLELKAKERGYIRRQELTGKEGNAIEVSGDARNFIAAELDQMAARLGQVDGRANGAAPDRGTDSNSSTPLH